MVIHNRSGLTMDAEICGSSTVCIKKVVIFMAKSMIITIYIVNNDFLQTNKKIIPKTITWNQKHNHKKATTNFDTHCWFDHWLTIDRGSS